MRILFLNPFHGGSHAAVAEGYARHSLHDVELMMLSIAGGWRWRMRGAAVTLARRLRERMRQETSDKEASATESPVSYLQVSRSRYDLILATDMLDLATFLGLTRDLTAGIPAALYFHENQLTYPLPAGRARDLAFPWINYTSALAADSVFFNSDFHRRAFLDALPGLLRRYHDHQELDLIDAIAAKAQVLPPGIDLARLDDGRPTTDDRPGTANSKLKRPEGTRNSKLPVILWNSRWEYDKGPEAFFAALEALEARGVDFRVIVAGEHIDPRAPEFVAARERLAPRTLVWGYAPDAAAYRRLLWQADIVVSTAIQEFFGISVTEAMYCGCAPILPRRLSYPELLPPEHHATCLYDDQDELVEKLQAAIRDLPALQARDFRSVAARYDWVRMAPRYDAAFEQVGHRQP
jgi:glycosyltransferase involved in cell wall biosynthesis